MILEDSSSEAAEPVSCNLVLQNRLDELTRLGDWINEQARQLGLSTKAIFRLDLALTEAVTNIIEYAYEDDETHQINITLRRQGNMTQLRVTDDGRPFNPLEHPPVVFPRSLEEASIGGLGIYLIRSNMDECHYLREENENIFTMIIYDSSEANPSNVA